MEHFPPLCRVYPLVPQIVAPYGRLPLDNHIKLLYLWTTMLLTHKLIGCLWALLLCVSVAWTLHTKEHHTMSQTNVVSMVMDVVLTIVEHSTVDTGTDKSGVIVTRVAAHARRGAFAPQRPDESFAQYQERVRVGRMAEAERKRKRRATMRDAVYNKAVDTLTATDANGHRAASLTHAASMEQRDSAVLAAVVATAPNALQTKLTQDTIASYTTRYAPFSKAQYRRGHYGDFLINESDTPFSVWPRYQGVTTRDTATIRERLDNHFARVASRGTWHTAGYSLKGTRMERTALNESVYCAMNAAQRSKSNPLLCIGTTPASAPYVNTFVSASPAPFTQTERLDHSRVAPTAGASDKMVAKHAPTQGTDKQGKALPFTYGGSVPSIPSDMHGLWCDRALGGVYGNGQSDIAYRPVPTADYHGSHKAEYAQGIHGPWYPTVIDDSPRDVVKASLFVPRNIRFEKRTAREFSELPFMCSQVANGRKGTSHATAESVTVALTVASYPRVESCYNR